MKNVTSIEQSERLIALGIPTSTASYCWLDCDTNRPFVMTTKPIGGYNSDYALKNVRPCWTLADLLDMLPRATRRDLFVLEIKKVEEKQPDNEEQVSEEWVVNYNYLGKSDFEARNSNLVQAVFEMVEWLADNEELFGTPKE